MGSRCQSYSAANAAIDHVHDWVLGSREGDRVSMAVASDGSYGIENDLICSFPVRSDGKSLHIVQGLQINDFARGKIDATVNELKGEKAMAAELGLVK